MRQRLQVVGLSVLVGGLLFANLRLAFGSDFKGLHWDKKDLTYCVWVDPAVQVISANLVTDHKDAIDAAINDWSSHTMSIPGHLTPASGPADITIFVTNVGTTDYKGLAIMEKTICTGTTSPPHATGMATAVDHAYILYNAWWDDASHGSPTPSGGSDMSAVRGIIAQELGHAFGLGHSEQYCMGKGYYPSLNNNVPKSNITGEAGVAGGDVNWKELDARFRIMP
jgi:predicted Zn-dependent protease